MTVPPAVLSARVQTMQIIAGALIMGLVSAGGVMVFLANNDPLTEKPDPPMLTYVALGVTALACVLSVVLPNVIAGNLIKQAITQGNEEGRANTLLNAYTSTLLIGLALCEGPGLFCMIAYLLEQNPLAFAGAGLALLLMLARFPTEDRVLYWLRSVSGRG